MPAVRVEAIIQAVGSVLAALVIAVGAWAAAGSFQPQFIQWGNNVASLQHLVMVAELSDPPGCSVLVSITPDIVEDSPDGPRARLSGQIVNEAVCEQIRRALANYTVGVRPQPVDR